METELLFRPQIYERHIAIPIYGYFDWIGNIYVAIIIYYPYLGHFKELNIIMSDMRYLKVCLVFIGLIATTTLRAQDDIEEVLLAGQRDAQTMVSGYIEPLLNGIGTGFAGGWYNTAKAHKPLGFDLTVTANVVYIPNDERFYSPVFERLEYNNGLDRAPTIAGPDGDEYRPEYRYEYTDENGLTYSGTIDGPPGSGLKENYGFQAVPVPMVNLGIGLIKKTDLKIRWSPTIDLDNNGTVKILGFALMHDIKQHMANIKNAPFDLSVLVGFTDLDLEYDLNEAINDLNEQGDGSLSAENPMATYDVNSWTFQGLISKKFSVLTLYGALGYNVVKSSINIKGDYEIRYDDGFGNSAVENFTDPVGLNFAASGPRMTAGFRLKLAILTLHADYTLQRYNTLTAGVGFAVR